MKAKSKLIKIYLFGDSICYGQLISSHQTWASHLARELESRNNADREFLTQNTGVNGNTSRQALERMRYDITSHLPDFILVQFGMNDCNYWETDFGIPRVSQNAFVANLEEIIKRAFSAGVKHCFLATNHPSNKGTFKAISTITYDKSNAEYNELIREVYKSMIASGVPITLIDNEANFEKYLAENQSINLSDLLLEDGVHLSELGHKLYIDYAVFIITSKVSNL